MKKGLGTRHLSQAQKQCDIYLGEMRKLEKLDREGMDQSLESALEWRAEVTAAKTKAQKEGNRHGAPEEHELTDMLERSERRGVPRKQLKQFAKVASGEGFPLTLAHAKYLEARRKGNPHGFHPLSQSTVANLKTAILHLRAFLKDDSLTSVFRGRDT